MKNQIKLISMKWRNLFSYGNKWNQFDFKTGISFISGKNVSNNRRNFTGKSSFLKIIPFALFGKVDGVTKKQIINWKNKKQGEVILKFSKNGIEYTIHRGIAPDIFSILKEGQEMAQSSNKKVFQTEFEDSILMIDFDTFMNIVYCDTNNMVSILNASKPVKRAYIEKLFNLHYFTQLKDVGNTKKRSIETAISKVETDIGIINNNINNLDINITKYTSDLVDNKNKIDSISGKINILKDRIDEVMKDTCLSKINELQEEKILIEKEKATLNLLAEKIKSRIFHCKSFKTTTDYSEDDIKKLHNKISEIDNALHSLVNNIYLYKLKMEKTNIDHILKNKREYTEKYNDDLKLYQQNEGILKGINITIKKKEKELKSKPTDGVCPTCMQTVDFDHIKEEYSKILNEHISEYTVLLLKNEKILKNIEVLKGFIDIETEAEEKYNTTKSSLKDFESEKKDLEYRLSTQREKVTSVEKILKEQLKGKKYQGIELKLKKFLESTLEKYSTLQASNVDIEKYEMLLKDIETQEKDSIILNEKLKGLLISKNSLNTYITNDRRSIKVEEKERKSKETDLLKYSNMLLYIKEVIKLCGDDKCKQYAISNFLPYLNERINYYLNKSGVLFYIKLSGWLDYDIIGPGIKNCSYGNLSGAEKISLDRSFQMASVDIKKGQSSALIDVLILDEVLDSSVDDDGLLEMMEIIKSKQEEDDSKVLIVSHRNELGGLNSMFDHRYLVSMDKYSNIKEY